MPRKIPLLIAIILILIVGGVYIYSSNFTDVGILAHVERRVGYSLDIIDKSVEIELLVKPEWIPFNSDRPNKLDIKVLEKNNTNIILENVWNRGNDIYFSFDTNYNLSYLSGEFLYNGIFNPDGTFASVCIPGNFKIYDMKGNKIDIGQTGYGPSSAFSFGIQPENYKRIAEGFYVKYSGMVLYKYSKK